MKKTIFLAAAFFSLTFLSSQETISKTIGEFTTLKVYDLIRVELIHSTENKIIISGENTTDVVIKNKNGKLKIRMKTDNIFNGKDTNVKLYFTSVGIIDANEGAFIFSDSLIKQYELDLRTQEGGHIKLKIDTKNTEIKSDSGGIIELFGYTVNQNIKLNTGGIYEGENLDSEYADVSIKAGGEANLKSEKVLDIKIRAGGDVNIYNTPEKVKQSKALGGRIKYIKL